MVVSAIDGDLILDVLKDLVGTNSVNPDVGKGPGESALSNFLYDRLSSIPRLEVVKQPVAGNRSNVVATLRGLGGGRSLMLNGHMDTVGVEGMTIDPFKPFIEDERLHGRGACDMKGGIAAMVGAAKALAESPSKLRGDVVFTFVADEEHLSIGVEKLVEKYSANSAIVGEPSEMRLATAHKGFVWIEIEFKGKAAHGSVPEKGIDAISHAARLVDRLGEIQGTLNAHSHPLLGPPKIHSSTVEGGSGWSIVPNRCVLRLERRTVPGENGDKAVKEIQAVLDALKRQDPSFNATACKVFERLPLETSPTEPIVKAMQQVLGERAAMNASVVGVPYWTDGAVLANTGRIPTCIFGPGDIRVAHSPDEYVKIDDVFQAAEVYLGVAQRFSA